MEKYPTCIQEMVVLIFTFSLMLSLCLARPMETTSKQQIKNHIVKRDVEEADYYPAEEDNAQLPPNRKRFSLAFDKLASTIKKIIDEPVGDGSRYAEGPIAAPLTDVRQVDLQRRGQHNDRVYWHCAFNAVTCFKKK